MAIGRPNQNENKFRSFYPETAKSHYVKMNTSVYPPTFKSTEAGTKTEILADQISGRLMGIQHYMDTFVENGKPKQDNKILVQLWDEKTQDIAKMTTSLGTKATRNMLNSFMSLSDKDIQTSTLFLQFRTQKKKDTVSGLYTIDKVDSQNRKVYELEIWLKTEEGESKRVWGFFGEKCEHPDNAAYMDAIKDATDKDILDGGASLTKFWKKQILSGGFLEKLNEKINVVLEQDNFKTELVSKKNEEKGTTANYIVIRDTLTPVATETATESTPSTENDNIPVVAVDDSDLPF